jgi:hypothetical protein
MPAAGRRACARGSDAPPGGSARRCPLPGRGDPSPPRFPGPRGRRVAGPGPHPEARGGDRDRPPPGPGGHRDPPGRPARTPPATPHRRAPPRRARTPSAHGSPRPRAPRLPRRLRGGTPPAPCAGSSPPGGALPATWSPPDSLPPTFDAVAGPKRPERSPRPSNTPSSNASPMPPPVPIPGARHPWPERDSALFAVVAGASAPAGCGPRRLPGRFCGTGWAPSLSATWWGSSGAPKASGCPRRARPARRRPGRHDVPGLRRARHRPGRRRGIAKSHGSTGSGGTVPSPDWSGRRYFGPGDTLGSTGPAN